VVEVPANVFVSPVLSMDPKGVSVETLRERVDLWLEESGDESVLTPHHVDLRTAKSSPALL
jgi:hypothetical protein